MFIRINHRNNFLLGSVKALHPESNEYVEYWRRLKKLSIEGFWSIDDKDVFIDPIDMNEGRLAELHQGKWRWMPPNLFFYANLGTIRHNPPGASKTAPKKKIRPFLRDIEWEFFYNWMECRGFSGFTGDNTHQCLRESQEEGFTKEKYKEQNCYDENGKFIEEKWHNLVNKDTGKVKAYMPAKEYLRKLHDQPLGYALWENMAKNLFMLGARGFGKSFMVGVGVILHELLVDGARRYTQDSIIDPYTVEILVGAAQSGKSSDLLSKTVEAMEDLPGSYGSGAEEEPSPMFKKMMGSIKPNNVKNPWIHWYEIDEGAGWKKEGSKSNIKHVTFSIENPEAAAGTRPGIIIVEEVGLCPNIMTVHGSNDACQMVDSSKFGSSIYLGTGGNMEKIVESERIFYNPGGYDFLEFENTWESDVRKIGWFVPAIYGLNNFKDNNGNTNVEAALQFKLDVRKKKMKAKDTSAIDLEMMNFPLVPSEMFLSKNGNIYPIALISEQIADVEGNEKYVNAEYVGKLSVDADNDSIVWKLDPKHRPIRKFPLDGTDDREGALVIYEHPDNEDGSIQYGRYIAGCDPYDHDSAGTTSLGSTIVYDRMAGRVVAEYTGRPKTAKQYYEYVRKILVYYNAKLLYENERKGIFDYFESKNCTYLLQEQPKYIKDIIQNSKVERGFGMHMNQHLKRYGEELIKTWLLDTIEGKGETEVLNVHRMRCLPLLKELRAYNPDGNFDRVMAFMMVMYFIQETRKIQLEEATEDSRSELSQSSFFNRGLTKIKRRRY